ncbi:hypothetical protein WJX82_002630 [Trebouxia sp. C0006]
MYKKPLQALRNASTKVAFQRQGKRTGDPRRLVPDCTVSKPWSRQLARSPHFCRYQVSMMSDRMLVTDIRQTISKINTTTRHISSIADLKRLAAHDEMHLHFEDMGQVMVELRNAVDDMSVRARHENRHIQNNN